MHVDRYPEAGIQRFSGDLVLVEDIASNRGSRLDVRCVDTYEPDRDRLGRLRGFSRSHRGRTPKILPWTDLPQHHKLLAKFLSFGSSARAAWSRTGMHTEITLSTLEHLAHRPGLLASEASDLYRCGSGARRRWGRRLNGRCSLYQAGLRLSTGRLVSVESNVPWPALQTDH